MAGGKDKDQGTSDVNGIRHRFAVPVADTICNEWIDLQSNLGFSLRVLIKAYVAVNGMSDAACMMNVVVPKKGRRPKNAEELIKKAFQGGDDTDIQFAQDAYDAKDMYRKDAESTKVDTIVETKVETVSAKNTSPPVQNANVATPPVDMMSMMGPGVASTKIASDNDDETDDLMNM